MGPPRPWNLFSSHTLTPALDSSGNPFEGSIGPAGAADWLFAVVDGDGTVVLSATSGQTVYVGILTFTISGGFAAAAIDWVPVTTATTVNDIWHIFAHGSHWISFSYTALSTTSSVADVTLLNFTTADITAAIASSSPLTPTSTVVYSQTDTTALVLRTDGGYSTNDHFISATLQGIALGLWRGAPGYAASTYLGVPVDPAVVTLIELSIGPVALLDTAQARGPSTIAATGSAQTLVGMTGFGLWHPKLWMCVPTDISPDSTGNYAENTLELLSMSPTQSDAASEGSIGDPGYNLQMGTFVRLANGDFVVVYKSVPAGTAEYPSSGGVRQEDWGSVEVKVLDPTLTIEEYTETFLEAASDLPADKMANRPHCVQWGRYLITVWVEATYDSSFPSLTPGNGYLRIDELVGVP